VVEGAGTICVSYVTLKAWPRRHYPRFFAIIAGIVTASAFQLFQAPGASYVLGALGVIAFFSLYTVAHAPEFVGELFKTEAVGACSTAPRPEPPNLVSAFWLLFLGVFVGIAVAASIVASVIMPPAYIVKWIFSTESLKERIELALNPGEQWLALRQKEREVSAENKRLAGIEAELTKALDELGKLPQNSARNIRIKIGSGMRVAGGAIYVGVYNTLYGSLCIVNVSSDKGDNVQNKHTAPGEAIAVSSSRGNHRVVLTGFDSVSCAFDVLKD
jgi:hypothetical protein